MLSKLTSMEKNTLKTYAHVQSLDKSIGKFKMADNLINSNSINNKNC
jgi:hypothetical protein